MKLLARTLTTLGFTTVLLQATAMAQGGPPPHTHRREDEAFFVLDGKFTFLSGEKQAEAGAGSFVYIPKGTLHTFKNIGAQPGRLLVTITPAGLEEFFYAIGSPANHLKNPPPFDPGVIDKIMRLANDYAMDVQIPNIK